MGGLDSEITDATTDILLEGANFSGPSIMRTSARSGTALRGLHPLREGARPGDDPAGAGHGLQAVRGAVRGRGVGGDHRRARAAPRRRPLCGCAPTGWRTMLGTDVPAAEMAGILYQPRLLGRRRRPGSRGRRCPSFRADLEREIDLIEEVARVHGLDQIPSTLPPRRVGRGGLDRAPDSSGGWSKICWWAPA